MNTNPETLAGWLAHLERVHPQSIALGLERVNAVKAALGLDPRFPIITVAGTNGKGSVCAMLEAILGSAGYKTGCYTSPHLLRYNERVRIARKEASDAMLIAAFEQVERARAAVPLTYFEFGTLAALLLFAGEKVDAAILEVGLGGRLDAVNAFDADCAVITSVALDHTDYLGETREQIGFEKAGVFRAGRPAVCAESDPPASLLRHAEKIGARLLLAGKDFGFVAQRNHWRYWGQNERAALPYPALRGACQLSNAAASLAALDALRERLPVGTNHIRTGLLAAKPAARFQVLPGKPAVILDVAHNPHAALALARNLADTPIPGKTFAVFAMLKDKDIAGVIRAVQGQVDCWLVADIHDRRGAGGEQLAQQLAQAGVPRNVEIFENPAAAYARACDLAHENDRIAVFGSFHTVAAVMRRRAENGDHP